MQAAARSLGVELHVLNASTERDFDAVFASLAHLRPSGLVIGSSALFVAWQEQLAALAVRHATAGGFREPRVRRRRRLVSYGGSLADAYRLAGIYTGRILKGDKPADLPVQQGTKFELFINLKTAKALGLEVPPTLLARADEVIE